MNVAELLAEDSGLTIKETIDAIASVNSYQKNKKTLYYIHQYRGDHDILKRRPKDLSKGGITEVNKIVLNYQKLITDLSASFLVGEPITLNLLGDNHLTEKADLFEKFKKHWKDSKTDTAIYKAVRDILVETRGAIQTSKSGGSIRHQTISQKNSIEFYLNFDDNNKADAFTRTFQQTDFNISSKTVEEKTLVDLVTANERFLIDTSTEDKVTQIGESGKIDGKMPVVYGEIEEPDFASVQILIDRLEKIVSKAADSGDYFQNPKLILEGTVVLDENMEKDSTGDIIRIKNSGDKSARVEYLTWDKQSESYTAEVSFLLDNIFSISSTPRLDFDNLKGLGAISGVALKLMFLATTIKVKSHKQNWLNEFVTRLISVCKNQLSNIPGEGNYNELEIGFSFNDGLPVNDKELIETLNIASSSASMSQQTAIENNRFVQNAAKEKELIDAEAQESFEGANVI